MGGPGHLVGWVVPVQGPKGAESKPGQLASIGKKGPFLNSYKGSLWAGGGKAVSFTGHLTKSTHSFYLPLTVGVSTPYTDNKKRADVNFLQVQQHQQ